MKQTQINNEFILLTDFEYSRPLFEPASEWHGIFFTWQKKI